MQRGLSNVDGDIREVGEIIAAPVVSIEDILFFQLIFDFILCETQLFLMVF